MSLNHDTACLRFPSKQLSESYIRYFTYSEPQMAYNQRIQAYVTMKVVFSTTKYERDMIAALPKNDSWEKYGLL